MRVGIGRQREFVLIRRINLKPGLFGSGARNWTRTMTASDVAGVRPHSLRHTHASQLIAAGIDVLTVGRRLGHGSPAITLPCTGHLFANGDDRAAEILEATFSAAAKTE